ncbi:MAG: sugar ABC transporter ATP-binding protein [Verrucomicrobia bacterium]|nr:sugar ABC transporter ATP-binding protein [Verrucomicrobiota bacterium]
MSPPLLELRAITKSFGGAQALRGVDFDLAAGEVHALVGENGAGKSTLIRIIAGAHPPDGGTVALAGRAVDRFDPAAAHALGVACIYQQPALFPDLTVLENIGLRLESGSPWRRVDWAGRRVRADQLLARIGAHLDPDREVRLLSMPEQQLVEIACAVGAGARIVIMDEPTASLTRQEQDLLHGVVRDLRRQGIGVIYISHRLEEVLALADRVTVLRDGENVGTHPTGVMTETELIRLMVGREISPIPPVGTSFAGAVLLSLRHLGCAASGVHGVNLELRRGEILGLAGLVGAGRTELARVLFGLTPATSGEIVFDGERVALRSPSEAIARGIAYVPEDRRRHGLVLALPVEENITLAIHRRLFPGSWLRPTAERSLTLEYLRDLAVKCPDPAAPAGSLSGGNQQKISLARWLATRPRLLILDEPTQGVDVGAKSELHRMIRRLAGDGLAVLLISSDLPEVIGLCDRIGVMRGGTLAAVLSGKSDPHDVMAVALGQAGGAAA